MLLEMETNGNLAISSLASIAEKFETIAHCHALSNKQKYIIWSENWWKIKWNNDAIKNQ